MTETAWRWAAQARTVEDAEALYTAQVVGDHADEHLTEARHAAREAERATA